MENLTKFYATGGCSCKLPAYQLHEMLEDPNGNGVFAKEMSNDDAAFSELDTGEILVSSVDYQNPVVDDPYLAGQIAALNALSDIFACGVQPQWAEVILAVPQTDPHAQVSSGREMMRGIQDACVNVGCDIVGGHTIVLPSPLVGLAVRGVAPSSRIKRKSGAQVGDAILITKPIGNGIAVAARQVGFLTDKDWEVANTSMLQSNSVGRVLGQMDTVTSLTDVTGFGIAGHGVEVASSSGVTLAFNLNTIPALPGTKRAANAGYVPTLAASNWQFSALHIENSEHFTDGEKMFLADPQTNGGLLVTVHQDQAMDVIDVLASEGVHAVAIGEVAEQGTHYCTFGKGQS